MNRLVSSILLLLGLVTFSATIPNVVSAQNARIHHVITKEHTSGPQFAKELWFSPEHNFIDQGGKYIALYITAKRNTKVNIQEGKDPATLQTVSVSAYQITTFNVPLAWEMKTSGVIENKAIHVWSKDVDILAYMMSHSPATSDGMFIIPVIGWGTDYIAAGYAALDVNAGTGDEPSEFVVVANQDNTSVVITPSCDLRANGSATTAEHQLGIPFTVALNKGDAVQFKSTSGGDVLTEDITGTIIHSNVPVGVIAGSQCPFIPVNDPACDHVVEMMPPIRTWSKTYYTAPFVKRKNGDTFLILGSTNNQVIYRTVGTVKQQYAIVNKGVPFWDDMVTTAAKWESDQPFMLVQYMNSAYHDYSGSSFGDPAEVVINPVEQFAKKVVFEVPSAQGSQQPYTNYINLVVNHNAAASTTINGVNIVSAHLNPTTIDGVYDVYVIDKINGKAISPGAYTVVSDSGVGVYVYGYGWFESYAWAGMLGTGTPNPTDVISPNVDTSGQCYTARVKLRDLTAEDPFASHLNIMSVDSSFNMNWIPDSTWTEGLGMDSTHYDIDVIDPSQPAYIQVTTYDIAGNATTVVSTYTPWYARIGSSISFGVGNMGGPALYRYDTIFNSSSNPYTPTAIFLKHAGSDPKSDPYGFVIDSADLTPIAPGGFKLIKVAFTPNVQNGVQDSVMVDDACTEIGNKINGNGGAADFYVDDAAWNNVPLDGPPVGPPYQSRLVTVYNTSKTQDIHINTIHVDSSEFTLDDPTILNGAGLLVPKNGAATVSFTFKPNYIPQIVSAAEWTSNDVLGSDANKTPLVKTDQLIGNAVQLRDTTVNLECVEPGTTLHFAIPISNSSQTATSTITGVTHTNTSFVNLTGHKQDGTTWDPASSQEIMKQNTVDTITLDFTVPDGVNGTYTDVVTPSMSNPDGSTSTIGGRAVKITVNAVYRDAKIAPATVTFPVTTYGDPASGVPQEIDITNTTTSDVTVNSVDLQQGNQYNAAFRIAYDLNTTPVTTFPQVLHTGDVLKVLVYFDGTGMFSVTDISTILSVSSNTCKALATSVIDAPIAFKNATVLGYNASAIFACGTDRNNITIQPGKTAAAGLFDSVISVTLTGPDAANFTPDTSSPGFDKRYEEIIDKHIPVIFTPSETGSTVVYHYTAHILVHSPNNPPITYVVDDSNTASVLDLTATSIFAPLSASAGSFVELPIDLSLNTNGLSTDLNTLKINGVRLTYIVSDSDLLDFENRDITKSLVDPPSGWKLDPSRTYMHGDTVVFYLVGDQPLATANNSLGKLKFLATLPKDGEVTKVIFKSMQLYTNDSLVGPCATPFVKDSNFTLILRCGDSTMRLVMQGKGSLVNFIDPATPDPVRGRTVTFTYANRGETDLTLAIYDALGHEVARPVDNVHHEAGAWKVNFDVSDLPSGTYTYRLSSPRNVVSKQFVIER